MDRIAPTTPGSSHESCKVGAQHNSYASLPMLLPWGRVAGSRDAGLRSRKRRGSHRHGEDARLGTQGRPFRALGGDAVPSRRKMPRCVRYLTPDISISSSQSPHDSCPFLLRIDFDQSASTNCMGWFPSANVSRSDAPSRRRAAPLIIPNDRTYWSSNVCPKYNVYLSQPPQGARRRCLHRIFRAQQNSALWHLRLAPRWSDIELVSSIGERSEVTGHVQSSIASIVSIVTHHCSRPRSRIRCGRREPHRV